jgi:hypothetical protein
MADHPGLALARAGDDRQWSARELDSRSLDLIEPFEQAAECRGRHSHSVAAAMRGIRRCRFIS